MVGRPITLAGLVLLPVLLLPFAFGAGGPDPFSGDLTTAHTSYVRYVDVSQKRQGNGLPTDFAAVAGHFAISPRYERVIQRECVVWFDGKNLDQRPLVEAPALGAGPNAHPGDESGPAAQDHDFDRDVQSCQPEFRDPQVRLTGAYAIVVERGDCDPFLGRDWIFRGHLDFVDPNDIYHEVQEYSYVCPMGGPSNAVPNPAFPGQDGGLSEALRDLLPPGFPPPPERHCNQVPPPHEDIDPENQSVGNPQQWVFCNARIQTLFREMAWITPIHEEVWDPTIQTLYNFALQIDTCDGTQCTDGSKDSFDDTSRSKVSHRSVPEDEEAIMRGNSYDFNATSTTFGKHRTNCRSLFVRWQKVSEVPGPDGSDCYPEDHRTAAIDIYVATRDPTGLWLANANGLTGANAYTGPGESTGPLYPYG